MNTASDKKIKLSIGVSGVAMTEMEAQNLASSVQSNCAYALGVSPESLEVEVSMMPPEEEETPPEADAEQGDMSAEDITAMTPEKFKASKGKIMTKMGAK